MARTSTFIKGKQTIIDSACFSGIIYGRDINNVPQKCYIIIEKHKWVFPPNEIRRYLNDLKQMGWNFTYKIARDHSKFIIDVNNMVGVQHRTAFFMAVRYLWEGGYGSEYSKLRDKFVEAVRHYQKLKEILPKEKNKLTILCIAANCYIQGNYNKFNSNHFFSFAGCKLLKDLKGINKTGSVNGHFAASFGLKYNDKLAYATDWTLKDYEKLFKKLKYNQ